MTKKYLDNNGLSYFFSKLKLLFATKDTATQSANGLMSSFDKTKLDGLDQLVESASGESVTTSDSSGLESLFVYGKSVQNGTPTPSAPIKIEVVDTPNLFNGPYNATVTGSDNALVFNLNGGGTAFVAKVDQNTMYTVKAFDAGDRFRLCLFGEDPRTSTSHTGIQYLRINNPSANYSSMFSTSSYNYVVLVVNTSSAGYDEAFEAQCEKGSTITSYIPYGCIGLNVDGAIAPIDLQGNVLASLPDGTKDELTVDSAGHVMLEKVLGVKKASEFTITYASGGYANLNGGLPLLKTSIAILSDMFVGTTAANASMANNEVKQTSDSIASPTKGQIRSIRDGSKGSTLTTRQTSPFITNDFTTCFQESSGSRS